MKLLLSILFCVFIANAIAPKGTMVTQPLTINSAYVSETSNHFLLQFKVPRTGIVAANCDSAKHVAMTGINDTIRVPRWVVFTTDTLFIYADVVKSISANIVYRLHYGKMLKEVNTSSTFTNCGVTYAYIFAEQSGTTTQDVAGGQNGTVVSPATIGEQGLFNESMKNIMSTGYIQTPTELLGANYITVECLVNPYSVGGGNAGVIFRNAKHMLMRQASDRYGFSRDGATLAYSAVGSVAYNEWQHIAIRSTVSGITFYKNGTISGTANQSSSSAPVAGTAAMRFGNKDGAAQQPWDGLIDKVLFYVGVDLSQGYLQDRYKTLFTNTFLTLGTPQSATSITPNPHTDTLKLVCSAENALTYQWYDNNVAVTGATDSVYTIYADSAFYSIKHVIYCLVNGSVKSGEWRYGSWGSNRSRWDPFLRPFKDAYKRAWK